MLRDRADGFLVLSGDDAWTLPLIGAGADGLVSVASERSAATDERARSRRAARRFRRRARSPQPRPAAAHRQLHRVESRSRSRSRCKMLGIIDSDTVRPPLAPITDANREEARSDPARVRTARNGDAMTIQEARSARDHAHHRSHGGREDDRPLPGGAGEGRDPRRGARRRRRVAGAGVGEGGDPRRVSQSACSPSSRRARSRSSTRTRFPTRRFKAQDGIRIVPGGSSIRRGAYHRQRRGDDAAGVRQRRRVRRRRDDDRLARAGRLVRADRQARAPLRRPRRSAACSSRSATCR